MAAAQVADPIRTRRGHNERTLPVIARGRTFADYWARSRAVSSRAHAAPDLAELQPAAAPVRAAQHEATHAGRSSS